MMATDAVTAPAAAAQKAMLADALSGTADRAAIEPANGHANANAARVDSGIVIP